MRKVLMALVAGMLVVGVSVGSGYADGQLNAPPADSPLMSVKALQKAVSPGGTVTVDLYVHNVSDLAVFQFAVGATGGEQGTLTLESIEIDAERQGEVPFVFFGSQIVQAVDMSGSRAGAMQMIGGREVEGKAYIATAVFRASAKAKGTFDINVQAGKETFLRDSRAGVIAFSPGPAAKVAVSERVSPRRITKRKRG